jgi:hypothetical protein
MRKKCSKKYHYTYYSYEEWGMGYFGSRSCDCLPEEDINYFGSFKDKNFKPTQKIILKDDYSTREEALRDEIMLHDYYDVVKNSHFANRAKQTSSGFTQEGITISEETRKKLLGRPSWCKGKKGIHTAKTLNKLRTMRLGKKLSEEVKDKMRHNAKSYWKGKKMPDEVRKKLSSSLKGNKNCLGRVLSEETKEKISKANQGNKHTEAHKKRVSKIISEMIWMYDPITLKNYRINKNDSEKIKNNIENGCIFGFYKKSNVK